MPEQAYRYDMAFAMKAVLAVLAMLGAASWIMTRQTYVLPPILGAAGTSIFVLGIDAVITSYADPGKIRRIRNISLAGLAAGFITAIVSSFYMSYSYAFLLGLAGIMAFFCFGGILLSFRTMRMKTGKWKVRIPGFALIIASFAVMLQEANGNQQTFILAGLLAVIGLQLLIAPSERMIRRRRDFIEPFIGN